jgi:transcriptional antiterminator RfaH
MWSVTMLASATESACPSWWCIRSKVKSEHIAATGLRKLSGTDVFLPRLRYRRLTRQGPRWTTEALFPGYLFASFDVPSTLLAVKHTTGVRGLVAFGERLAEVPAQAIEALQRGMDNTELRVLPSEPAVGQEVLVAREPFAGLSAVVREVMPGSRRIRILLDFLGRQTPLELAADDVVPAAVHALAIGPDPGPGVAAERAPRAGCGRGGW